MASQATLRVNADTTGLSLAMSRMKREVSGAGKEIGNLVPGFNLITSKVGIIGLAVAGVAGGIAEWRRGLEEGNRALTQAVEKTRQLVGATGDFGAGERFRTTARDVATRGALNVDSLLGAANTFRGTAPGASEAQTNAAMRYTQRAGSFPGMDPRQFSEAMGVLIAHGAAENMEEAADMATVLITALGAQAQQIITNTLPRLLEAGLSPQDAISIVVAIAKSSTSRTGRTRIASRIEQAADARVSGFGAYQRIIAREAPHLGAIETVQTEGALGEAISRSQTDQQNRTQVAISQARNVVRESALQRGDENQALELLKALQEAERSGRGGFGRFFRGMVDTYTRNVVRFTGVGQDELDQAVQGFDAEQMEQGVPGVEAPIRPFVEGMFDQNTSMNPPRNTYVDTYWQAQTERINRGIKNAVEEAGIMMEQTKRLNTNEAE